jgi:L-ascorbate metabolism protein UlaG (beta-lactamase superfamily)
VKSGRELLEQIETSVCASPTLWWLGQSGFALKYRQAILYVDPFLGSGPFRGCEVTHAGLILCTHAGHVDAETVPAMLAASPRARLVIPKSVAGHANSLGIPYGRMVTTDSGLRVEYLDDRIYAVPSAHDKLDWTPLGGYPYLGYLVRFGGVTIYHAGDCVPYEDIVARLRPYSVTIALLPIAGRPHSFEIAEAAQLAEDIGARWLVPMNYENPDHFIEHMLGHRPAQRFKVFERGEMWALPA